MSVHHIIYLPGLGDPNPRERATLLGIWKYYGVNAYYYPVHWSDGKPFEPKLERLLKFIDKLKEQGHEVSLVGVSAGASAAINAYARRPNSITRVVCICGKLRNFQTISPLTFKRNPSFKDSLDMYSASISKLSSEKRKRILSARPLWDGVVPVADTHIEGAQHKTMISFGHALSIAYALTVGSYSFIRFFTSKK